MTPEILNELSESYLNDIVILEYSYPRLASGKFTFHKYPDPNKKNAWKDDGQCEVCKRKGTYTLIAKDKPAMCYKCYQAVRAYRNLKIDVLHMHKKKVLSTAEIKKIVTYMNGYSKKKATVLAAIGTSLLLLASDKTNSSLKKK